MINYYSQVKIKSRANELYKLIKYIYKLLILLI